jgi:hypothetical protein
MHARKYAVAITVLMFAGCSGEKAMAPPNLYPVTGVVLLANGQPLTTGGMIEFRSTQDSKTRSISAIDEQGQFSLSSRAGDVAHPGAQPGIYQVTVYPKADKYVEPIEYPQKVTIAPKDMKVTIKLGVAKI